MGYWDNRLSQAQRQGIMDLDMLTRSFEAALEMIGKERMSERYKWWRRDAHLVQAVCRKLVKKALEGCPADMADIILKQSRDYQLAIRRMNFEKAPNEIVMPMDDEWQLIQIALDSRCSMCLKTAAEANGCALRKLLRRYANEPDPEWAACGFMGCGMSQPKRLNKQKEL